MLSNQLVKTSSGSYLSTRREGGTREQVSRLRAMDVSLECLRVIEAADEQHLAL